MNYTKKNFATANIPDLRTTYKRSNTKKVIIFLSLLPLLDALMGLNDDLLLYKIGVISIFQLIRTLILLVLVTLILRFRKLPSSIYPVAKFVKFFSIALIIFSLKELFETGQLSLISFTSYSKIFFWLILWIVSLLYCQSREDCLQILKGIVLAGIVMAIAVFFSYLTGQNTLYSEHFSNTDSTAFATAGGYRSGKTIAGPLIIAAIVTLYLGRAKRTFLASVLAVFFAGGSFLTYNRTGLVSLLLSMVWLLIWRIQNIKEIRNRNKSIFKFSLLLVVSGILYFSVYGFEGLANRWGDVGNSSNNLTGAGSGRGGLWLAAIDWFQRTDLLNQIFGAGYKGMFIINYQYFHNPMIHSHSDLFDLLLIGGLVGVCMWIMFFYILFTQNFNKFKTDQEFPFVIALNIVIFSYSLLTSAFYGPNMMGITILSIVAMSKMRNMIPRKINNQ